MARSLALFLIPVALTAADGAAPGMNHFAVDAYRELAGGHGNLILSPFSIAAALSMAFEGARGQTADEMAKVLHRLPGRGDGAALASLADQLQKQGNSGANQLLTANRLWVQRGFPILADFQQTLATQYKAPLTPVDFSKNPEQARAAINNWTEEQTKGRIHDLFGPGSLTARDRLVLTSAIYFLGKWQSTFPLKGTRPAPFHLDAQASVDADFMNQSGQFGYAETPTAQILELKYAGTPMAFDIVLPKTVDGIGALDSTLDSAALSAWLATLATRSVEVSLPKFRAESEFSLKETLAHLGMASAFSGGANFSGIDGRRDLSISAVKHKAFVDVTEQGTEAAAATGISIARTSMMVGGERAVFHADHPFLFLIRDTQSGTILFAGRLTNPKG